MQHNYVNHKSICHERKQIYILPEDKSCNMVSELLIATSQLFDLKTQVVERVMNIQNTETLQSLIVYIDQNVLPKTDNFEEEWERTSEGRATAVARSAHSSDSPDGAISASRRSYRRLPTSL